MVHKIYLFITKVNIFFLHIQHLFHCFEIASSIFDWHFLFISVHNKFQMTGQNAKASNSIDLHFSHTLPALLIIIIDTKYCQVVSLWNTLCSGYAFCIMIYPEMTPKGTWLIWYQAKKNIMFGWIFFVCPPPFKMKFCNITISLGFGHETVVCAVYLAVFLFYPPLQWSWRGVLVSTMSACPSTSQVIHYARICSKKGDLLERVKSLTKKLLRKHYTINGLKSSLKKCLKKHRWITAKLGPRLHQNLTEE